MKHIALLNNSHIDAVNQLRLEEYNNASGFYVAPQGILWNRSDEQSIVLGALDDDKLVASVRIELIKDATLVDKKMECPWTFPFTLTYPVAITSRAVTQRDYRGKGLYAAMSCYTLKFAKQFNSHFSLATFVAGQQRLTNTKHIGYQLFENTLGWQHQDFQSENHVYVAALNLNTHYQQAIIANRKIAGDVYINYPWTGPIPEKKFVTVVK